MSLASEQLLDGRVPWRLPERFDLQKNALWKATVSSERNQLRTLARGQPQRRCRCKPHTTSSMPLSKLKSFVRYFQIRETSHRTSRRASAEGWETCPARGFSMRRNPQSHHSVGLHEGPAAASPAGVAATENEWSSIRVEGQINRLKTIKRQMYGRSGFLLLCLEFSRFCP